MVATYLAVPAALAGSDLVATVRRRVAELIAVTARVAVTPLPIDFALTVSMAGTAAPRPIRRNPGSARC